MAASVDGAVGYDVYGQEGGHAFRLADWEGQHPPMKGQERPHQAQKGPRYQISSKDQDKKSRKNHYRDDRNILYST